LRLVGREVLHDGTRRGGEGNAARLTVLRPLPRKLDPVLLELGPTERGDLSSPAAGQEEEMDERPEGMTELLRGPPDLDELDVGEDPLASSLGADLRQLAHRVDLYDPPAHAPREQSMKMSVEPSSGDRGAALGNAVDEV